MPLDTPDDPAYQPTTMTEREYKGERARLGAQLAGATTAEQAYRAGHELGRTLGGEAVEDAYGDAWNAAHDAVDALTAALECLDREWNLRDVSPVDRWLVSNNID